MDLLKHESWGGEMFSAALEVAQVLGATDGPSDPITIFVHGLACGMFGSKPEDFISISEHAAGVTSNKITATFLSDKFRLDLARLANDGFIHSDQSDTN